MKQVVFEKNGIEIWDNGAGAIEGWYVSSKNDEYVVFIDEGMYHLSLAKKLKSEPPILENICTDEDIRQFEKIANAVEKMESLKNIRRNKKC